MGEADLIIVMMIFGISLIWSLLAIQRKSAVFSALAWVCWFSLSIASMVLADSTVLYHVGYLYFGFGVVFLVYGLALIIESYNIKQKEKEWELP